MQEISWFSHTQYFYKFDQSVDEAKEQISKYKQLFEEGQITEKMLELGILQQSVKLAKEIKQSPEECWDEDEHRFIFNKSDTKDITSGEDKEVGTIGFLCPECNNIITLGPGSSYNLLGSEIDCMEHFDKVGTRMKLLNGKFGKFWGCTNYPVCTKTVSTYENWQKYLAELKEKAKPILSIYDVDECDDRDLEY